MDTFHAVVLGLFGAIVLYVAYMVPPIGLVIAAGFYIYWLVNQR